MGCGGRNPGEVVGRAKGMGGYDTLRTKGRWRGEGGRGGVLGCTCCLQPASPVASQLPPTFPLTSARVGAGLLIMLSSMLVATMTGLPRFLHPPTGHTISFSQSKTQSSLGLTGSQSTPVKPSQPQSTPVNPSQPK